jgi:hypothetical protein
MYIQGINNVYTNKQNTTGFLFLRIYIEGVPGTTETTKSCNSGNDVTRKLSFNKGGDKVPEVTKNANNPSGRRKVTAG